MRKAHLVPVLLLVFGLSCLALPTPVSAQVAVGISVRIGPPALPVYAQPICPGIDYIWVPGYWAWGGDGYYWVPGTWVLAPEPGLYWTPGWWGYDEDGDDYDWHPGYWGPHVGFYGGINYGFGYFGVGYVGGEWRDRHFYYNRAVTNVNVTVVRNVYVNRTVERNVYVNDRVSYNGGPDGVRARPTPREQRWSDERRYGPTPTQEQHVNRARDDRSLHYNQNHGRPPVPATQRPSQFSPPGAARPRDNRNQNEYQPPANQNRSHQQYQPQPDNRRPENRDYNPPPQDNRRPENRNYSPPPQDNRRPENRDYYPPQDNAPRNRGRQGGEPRGNQDQARPHNEQPRGNPGGERDGRGNGRDDGRD
ncbi:MAG: YXWGXW repeat-containing protein [Acidobacteriota bacterium]|nr:YXWGXW repeat-containing protein [Acidobacteriota bacterium]